MAVSYDMKTLTLVSAGVSSSTILFGAKTGQSESAPDPLTIGAVTTYINGQVSGDATITAGGVLTIANGAVSSAKFGGLLALNHGGTNADLSGTGGASQFLRQNSLGAAITVVQPNFTDLAGSISVAQLGTGTTVSDGYLNFYKTSVDFNSGNSDTAFTITLPGACTRYIVGAVRISNASHTLVTATCGLFTGAGGTGTAIVSGGSAISVSATSDNTLNNAMGLTIANQLTQSYNLTNEGTLYFRVATPEGAPATADVTINVTPLP